MPVEDSTTNVPTSESAAPDDGFFLPTADELGDLDEPSPPEASADPDHPDHAETTTAEPDQDDAAAPEAAADDEPDGQGKTPASEPNPHQPDKGLQKVQQDFSAYRRQNDERFTEVNNQLKDLTGQVQGVLEAIKAQGGQATPAQEQQLEEAGDDLAELTEVAKTLDERDEFDSLSVAEAKKLLAGVQKLGQARTKPAKPQPEELDQQVQKVLEKREQQRQAEAEQRRAAVQRFRDQFQTDHPDVADRFEELAKAAHEQTDRYFGDRSVSADARNEVLNLTFDRLVEQAESAAAPPPANPPKPAGRTTTPPKSAKGTQTTVPGASATAPARADDGWVSDSDLDSI